MPASTSPLIPSTFAARPRKRPTPHAAAAVATVALPVRVRAAAVLSVTGVGFTILAVAFAAFTLGGTQAWAQAWLAASAAAAMVFAAGGMWLAGRAVFSLTLLPMALFVGLVTFQLLPLPTWLLDVVSPGTATLRAERLADVGVSGDGSVSLSPLATRRHLHVLLPVCCIFVAVLHLAHDPRRLRMLLAGLLAVGTAAAGFALLEQVIPEKRIPTLTGWQPGLHGFSGPFRHHSHFGQFANLAFGAGLGLLFVCLWSRRSRSGRAHLVVDEKGGLTKLTHSSRLKVVLPVALGLGLIAMSIPLSLTRAGTIALLISATLAAVLHGVQARPTDRVRRRRRSRWTGLSRSVRPGNLWTPLALIGLVIAGALGFIVVGADPVLERMNTVADADGLDTAVGIRWVLWQDSIAAIRQLPVLGAGLGAFAETYPFFMQDGVGGFTATHAENAFVQLVYETGLGGAACAALFATLVFVSVVRALGDTGTVAARAVPGVAAGLVAILIQSATDYGQYVPAVAVTTAALMAVAAGWSSRTLTGGVGYGMTAGLVVTLLAASAWAFTDARRDAAVERILTDAGTVLGSKWEAEPANLRLALEASQASLALRPGDPRLHYERAMLRWRAARAGGGAAGRDAADAIAADLNAARPHSPLNGRLPAGAAWLSLQGGATAAEVLPLLRHGYAASRDDQAFAFAYARAAAEVGDADEAVAGAMQARAARMNADRVATFLAGIGRHEEAEAVAGSDRNAWLTLGRFYRAEGDTPRAVSAERRTYALLREAAFAGDVGALAELAEHENRAGNRSLALDLYLRVVNRRPGDTQRRLAYASLLDEARREKEALTQLRLIPPSAPNNAAARSLEEAIKTRQAAAGEAGQ